MLNNNYEGYWCMEALQNHGTTARRLKLFWYGGGLAIWAVAVVVTGLLVLLGQVRQVEQEFVDNTHAALRQLEQALKANEQALAAMLAFLEADSHRHYADFDHYVEHLLRAYPQIRQAALLLLPERAETEVELLPLAGAQLAEPIQAALASSLWGVETIEAPIVLMPFALEQEAYLLVQPLQVQETTRLAVLLEVAVSQLLPAAESLPVGMALALRLQTAAVTDAWWRANDYSPATQLWPWPTLRFVKQLGSAGQPMVVASYRRLSWGVMQPGVLLVFITAAVLGLLLALAYGHSRLQREQGRRDSELQLYRLANYDSLTGLPNRNLFKDRLQQALTQARLRASGVALCFVDLDGFKAVNDSAGHDAGDRLLQLVARRLLAAVRSEDTVARLSGDEFVVVMEGMESREDAERVVAKLQECFREPFAIGANRFPLTASIGFAVFPDDGEHPAQLLRRADARMYASKYADWSATAVPAWLPAETVPNAND